MAVVIMASAESIEPIVAVGTEHWISGVSVHIAPYQPDHISGVQQVGKGSKDKTDKSQWRRDTIEKEMKERPEAKQYAPPTAPAVPMPKFAQSSDSADSLQFFKDSSVCGEQLTASTLQAGNSD